MLSNFLPHSSSSTAWKALPMVAVALFQWFIALLNPLWSRKAVPTSASRFETNTAHRQFKEMAPAFLHMGISWKDSFSLINISNALAISEQSYIFWKYHFYESFMMTHSWVSSCKGEGSEEWSYWIRKVGEMDIFWVICKIFLLFFFVRIYASTAVVKINCNKKDYLITKCINT